MCGGGYRIAFVLKIHVDLRRDIFSNAIVQMLVFACLILCSTHHAALWHVRSSWCSTRSPELKKDLQMYFPSIIVFKHWWYFLANWVVIFLLFFPIKCSLFSNGLTQSVFNRWICCRFLGQPSEPSQLKFVFRVTFL